MKLTSHNRRRAVRTADAFTMVEVALSLAIIAFAVVAIIGILPTGMQVQRDNREETVINQDGQFILEVLKNGQTNVTLLAQNFEWIESYTNIPPSAIIGREGRFDRTNLLQGTYSTNELAYRIAGLLSTPRFVANSAAPNGYISNWVQAKFVGNSGPLADRLTEDPVTGNRDFAFGYLVTVDIAPIILSTTGSNYAGYAYATNLQDNLYSLRVNLSWPVYPNNTVGNGRKSFHSLVSGRLTQDANGFYRFRPNEYNGL
jgi:type II secretory pathway pseudopilin PulG